MRREAVAGSGRAVRLALAGALLLLALAPAGARAQAVPPSGGSGTIVRGEIPADGGFGLIVFGGGTFAQLVAAAGCPGGQVAFWTTSNGRFVPFIPRAEVQAANAAFAAIYPNETIPPNTPLVGRCLEPSPRVVTLDDNGITLELRTGEEFELRLGANYSWLVDIADPSVVDRSVVIAIYPPPPRGEGVYRALRPGRTTLTATGRPICDPACMMPSAVFSMTVVVR
ncbi:MAG: hypothetical protein K1X87_02085 [Dehalococcoidia bacterium]|mgnify:CR=1 FL=1|nr:hypothetical protein [Dehalococcoidia bacterium]